MQIVARRPLLVSVVCVFVLTACGGGGSHTNNPLLDGDTNETEQDADAVCTNGSASCDANWVRSCQGGVWVRVTDCTSTGKTCQGSTCVAADGDEAEAEVEVVENEAEIEVEIEVANELEAEVADVDATDGDAGLLDPKDAAWCVASFSADDDENINLIQEITYDLAGNPVSSKIINKRGAQPEDIECLTWTYDSAGNITRYAINHDCSGEPRECEFMEYDSHGTLIKDTSGSCDYSYSDAICYQPFYDAKDELTKIWRGKCPVSATNLYECNLITYDANGYADSQASYNGGDCIGDADICTASTHDAKGNLLTTSTLDCATKEVDSMTTYIYNDASKVVTCRNTSPIGECKIVVWDNLGLFPIRQRDGACNGVPTTNCITKTKSGDTERWILDTHCDGKTLICNTYTFDTANHKVTLIEGPCDGSGKKVTTHITYTACKSYFIRYSSTCGNEDD